MNKRTALYISLAVITASWIYEISFPHTNADLPADFSAFMLRIAAIKILNVAIIFALMKLEGASWSELGLTSNKWPKQLAMGLLFGVVFFILFNVGVGSVLNSIFPKLDVEGTSVMQYFTDTSNLVIWLLAGIFAGGFTEELGRIFVLTRFEKAYQKTGLYLALIVSSTVFGMGHLYQGISGVIGTALYGLCIGLIFIRRRSAIEVMTAHAFSDTLAILAAFGLASHGG
jgi:membrane protease YdiL (CAAX protease family)